jgi:hypothetical protein
MQRVIEPGDFVIRVHAGGQLDELSIHVSHGGA